MDYRMEDWRFGMNRIMDGRLDMWDGWNIGWRIGMDGN